jgi:hypothetical protein
MYQQQKENDYTDYSLNITIYDVDILSESPNNESAMNIKVFLK